MLNRRQWLPHVLGMALAVRSLAVVGLSPAAASEAPGRGKTAPVQEADRAKGSAAGQPTGPRVDVSGLLASEMSKLKGVLSGTMWERVRSDVERHRQLTRNDDAQLGALVAKLQYMREKGLFDREPMNAEVREQLSGLTTLLFDGLVGGALGPVPLKREELRELCSQCSHAPVLPSIDPYFRLPISQDGEKKIRATLTSRLAEMGKYRHRLWMNAPEVPLGDKRTLWRAFCRSTVRLLIVQPILNDVSRAIGESNVELLKAVAEREEGLGKPAAEDFVPPQSDESAFDSLRTSNERVFAIALSLLPILADHTKTSQGGEWNGYDVSFHLKSAYPPYTEVSANLSLGVSGRWWIVLFAHLDSNDDRTLAEGRLHPKCFAYDVEKWTLYEHAPGQNALSELVGGRGQRLDKSVFFLDDYRYGDVLNALNCANVLARLWRLRNASPAGEGQSIPELELCQGVFGSGVARCTLKETGGQLVDLALGDGRIRLEGTRGNGEVILSDVTLPPVRFLFHLAPNQELARMGASVEVQRELFAEGAVIHRRGVAASNSHIAFRAPGRLEAVTRARRIAGLPFAHVTTTGPNDAVRASASLMRANVLLSLHAVLDQIVSDLAAGNRNGDCAADLYLLDCLEAQASAVPFALRFYLNDVRIGLLIAMGRRDDALPLLAKQGILLSSNPDREYGLTYLGFYAQPLRRQGAKAIPDSPPAKGPPPPFLCYFAEEEKQRKGAAEKPPSRAPQFRMNLAGRQTSAASDAADRMDVASSLYILVKNTCGEGALSAYIKGHLDLLWERFPHYRTVGKDPAHEILSLWRAELTTAIRGKDDYTRASRVVSLIWQTYHSLVAAHHPLGTEEIKVKSSQLSRLKKVFERLDSEIARNTNVPQEVLPPLRAETERCVKRLDEYARSPRYPFFYYPLHDAAFKRAVDRVESRMEGDVQRFAADYVAQRDRLLRKALQVAKNDDTRVDFFQNDLRSWAGRNARALVALTMGNVVRQYGMIERRFDYADAEVFPFWKVTGMSVAYRMQEGLDTQLSIDWTVLTRPPGR